MTEAHRGTPARERTFPRRQFLAYTTLIAKDNALASPTNGDLDEQVTWEQWEAERAKANADSS